MPPFKGDPVIKGVVTLAALVIVITGLRVAGGFFLPLFTAIFIAVTSLPLVRFLETRCRLPEPAAISVTLLLDMGFVVGFASLIWVSFSGFSEALPRYQMALNRMSHSGIDELRELGFEIDYATLEEVRSAGAMMGVAGDVFHELTQIVGNSVLVILLLGFLLFESRSAREKLQLLLGRANPYVDQFAIAAHELQRYLVVKTMLSAITATLTGIWVTVCNVDFPLLWALLTFVLNYIPSLGPALALIPVVAISLVTLGPYQAALVAAGHLTIGFVIGNMLEPRMMGQTLGLSTLVVFVSMFFWGWMWGPVGALFAVPLTMLLRSLLETVEDTRWIAVLLGSGEYVEKKRKAWGWQTLEEQVASASMPAPKHLESLRIEPGEK